MTSYTDKHLAKATEVCAGMGNGEPIDDIRAVAQAIANAERDAFKRAAEIARGNSGEYDFQSALAEGRDFDYGFHHGKNHAGDSILAEIILSEAGEGR